ncbi:MAG TPA: CoA pyrophosphatase [Chitinophagales bacterium]|jgi:8-oxo-dGTP pyrophosphatase MutT (NUDIX family)|nr:CoA pyrophosphatase [Chitinophagales bacterium]HQV78252.1 CoA pyrophosphatase [Chitinophagales bacterium]HQW80132.1 CoA pyrophosphatase [Chitinophagales bacterium]HRB66673.1 CoA pyrophosphatase [Chitinophagales bacterium]
MFHQFAHDLKNAFKQPLPGKSAQAALRPYLKLKPSLDAPPLPNPKRGAVMSLIYPIQSVPHILFIERPIYKGVHSGQIAFPGGKIEQSDASILAAALRETHEEVGVLQNEIEVVGPLTSVYVLASNFMVFPFVGILDSAPQFILEKKEVANIMEVPLSYFLEPGIIKEKPIKSAIGFTLMAPYYDLYGKTLWGATAMMVSELNTILHHHQIKLK